MGKKKKEQEKPVTVHITNHNKFEKGVGAFITNLNHLTLVMDAEGNMKMDLGALGIGPQTTAEQEDEAVGHDESDGRERLPTDKQMAIVCEQTLKEGLWWGNTPWSVVYRIYCIKGYKGTIADFIDDVQRWPFKKPFAKKCNRYSVEKPLRRAKIMGPIEKWRADGASEREIKLGERLAELLSVEIEEGTA